MHTVYALHECDSEVSLISTLLPFLSLGRGVGEQSTLDMVPVASQPCYIMQLDVKALFGVQVASTGCFGVLVRA